MLKIALEILSGANFLRKFMLCKCVLISVQPWLAFCAGIVYNNLHE